MWHPPNVHQENVVVKQPLPALPLLCLFPERRSDACQCRQKIGRSENYGIEQYLVKVLLTVMQILIIQKELTLVFIIIQIIILEKKSTVLIASSFTSEQGEQRT